MQTPRALPSRAMQTQQAPIPERGAAKKTVLHVGSGYAMERKLHEAFEPRNWREIRIDIDPQVKPDLVADQTDLPRHFATASVGVIWSLHSIEHLHRREVPSALSAFAQVLRPDGFCLIRFPDLEVVCRYVLNGAIDAVANTSPAGPVTPLEMLYWHGASIERDDRFMEHKTGFTAARLGNALLEADFEEVRVSQHYAFDLWAVAFMHKAPIDALLVAFKAGCLPFDQQD
jgi:SAM-dependent methyltransferase